MSEQSWLRFMPRPLVRHIEGRPHRIRVLTNVAWIFGDNILRTGVRVVLGVWIARYLGPEQFGLLSYAIALVSIFSVFVNLGLNIVVVRDLVRDPDSTNEILGTACFLQFIGSCVAFTLLLVIVEFARPIQPMINILCVDAIRIRRKRQQGKSNGLIHARAKSERGRDPRQFDLYEPRPYSPM